ncbi:MULTISPECIES: hypothetical protein [Frankia]|uniref:hypothetical protein n=1 Tax=Frankia TaxID=1854 RepID=UPI0021191D00|nr:MULTISPECIES: hypothetical protein [Frankia]
MAADALRAVAWTCAVSLTARHTVGAWQLARTHTWLRDAGSHPFEPSAGARWPEVHVIVPVLREQAHVGTALAWWKTILPAFPGMSLTMVSTAREEHERDLIARAVSRSSRLRAAEFPQLSVEELAALRAARRASTGGNLPVEIAATVLARTPLTREVIGQLLTDAPHKRVRHVTYPGLGRKAAQVNYAARGLPPGGYLAVYDIDSRPTVEDLTVVYALLSSRRGRPSVVQQHALHAAPQAAGRGFARGLVRGSATLQSVWTLRREIPYARRYHAGTLSRRPAALLRAGLAQPVGHGLFVRGDILAEIGGLCESSVLDDVPTGVPLTLRGIPTASVPRTTTVPSPACVTEIISQGRRWFGSYLDYPTILRAAARTGDGTRRHRYLLAGIATYRAAAWLGAGPVTGVALVTAAAPRSGRALQATAGAGLVLTAVVPAVLTAETRSEHTSAGTVGRDCVELLAAYLLRSVGPWLAVADALLGRQHATTTPAPKAHRDKGTRS